MEAIVIGLAIPVAGQVSHASPQAAGIAGGGAAVSAVLLAGLARKRLSWTLAGGSLLQLLVIAGGAGVPVMDALGNILAGLGVLTHPPDRGTISGGGALSRCRTTQCTGPVPGTAPAGSSRTGFRTSPRQPCAGR